MAKKISMERAKRSNGLMQKCFRYEGKAYFVYGHTEKELREKEELKRAELKAGYEKRKNPSVDEYFIKWLERKRQKVTEATLRRHSHMYKSISQISVKDAGRKFGELRIKDITLDDLLSVQSELAQKHKTRGVNDTMALLKCILKTATDEGLIDRNPANLIESLKRTEPEARRTIHRALEPEEQKAFFDADVVKNSYYYNVFRFALYTGLRIGEIASLRNSDIYQGFIHVERTVTRTESGAYVIGENCKTEAGRRKIPLTPEVKAIIKEQKAINSALDNGIANIDDLIFKTPRRGIIISWGINKEIARLCDLIGIERFTIHCLRATFCTRMIQAGVAPKTLQELMGHSDISVTMNVYSHAQDQEKIEAMQKLSAIAL